MASGVVPVVRKSRATAGWESSAHYELQQQAIAEKRYQARELEHRLQREQVRWLQTIIFQVNFAPKPAVGAYIDPYILLPLASERACSRIEPSGRRLCPSSPSTQVRLGLGSPTLSLP